MCRLFHPKPYTRFLLYKEHRLMLKELRRLIHRYRATVGLT